MKLKVRWFNINCSKEEFKYYKAFSHFPKDNLLAYELFQNIYNDIPAEDRLKILIKIIYGEFKVDGTIFYWIKKCLDDETESIRNKRICENKRSLDNYIDINSLITVYRGINSESYDSDALSWSLSYNVAKYFAIKGKEGKGQVTKGQVHIGKVILFNNIINEEEIIVMPGSVKKISYEDVEYDETFFREHNENSMKFDKLMEKFIMKMEE